MADPVFDFAVLGSTPLAFLLAGLLAGSHGRKVALVGRSPSPFQPWRGFDLSVAPVTRPATWALLKRTTPEVIKLLGIIDRQLVRRLHPHIVAQAPAAIDALGHMRHVAAGYGYPVERLASRTAAIYRFREAALIDRRQFGEFGRSWCAGLGVTIADPEEAAVTFGPDGPARIELGTTTIEATRAILADDEAILAHLGSTLPPWLASTPTTAILTEPLPALPGSMIVHADTGVVVGQRPGGGAIVIAPGTRPQARARVAAAIEVPTRLAGEASFGTIGLPDGAPFLGEPGASGVTAIAGFGLLGAFLVPAIARHLAGAGSDDERAFFTARAWGAERSAVAEWRPLAAVDAAA